MLKLYNTRTRRVEEFRPLHPPHVRIYVCGLTPSAEPHIGHFRTYLFFDVLRRYLEHLGYDVRYVQNVTDIDDRSIARAMDTGEHWYDIVRGFYAMFKDAWRKLGLLPLDAHNEPYATRFIPQIQIMISELIGRDLAYVARDGIYYRVSKFAGYGALSNRNLEELQAGARIEIDEFKEDPLDFALWKFAKPGEPNWPFEGYGAGRPGWHIECSAMARELLDQEGCGFDIHGGGADLIFPHHENEIAQSEPLMRSPPMSNFWVHGGLLLHESKKMSKSLGNFEPVGGLLERHDPQAIRLLFLQTGYSKVMNFTEGSITAAAAGLQRLKATYRSLALAGAPSTPQSSGALVARIEQVMGEDMNTAAAIAELHRGAAPEEFGQFIYALQLLGLSPSQQWMEHAQLELPDDLAQKLVRELGPTVALNGAEPQEAVAHVIALRTKARAQKDWTESDRLRDALARAGVALEDSKDGTTWTVRP